MNLGNPSSIDAGKTAVARWNKGSNDAETLRALFRSGEIDVEDTEKSTPAYVVEKFPGLNKYAQTTIRWEIGNARDLVKLECKQRMLLFVVACLAKIHNMSTNMVL